MAFGLSKDGFKRKTYLEILEGIKSRIETDLDIAMNFSETSPEGQLSRIFADQLDEAWKAIEAIYYSQYGSTSFGVSLDRALEFRGNRRLSPRPTTVNARVSLSENSFLPKDSRLTSSSGVFLYTSRELRSEAQRVDFEIILSTKKNEPEPRLSSGQKLSSDAAGFLAGETTTPLLQGLRYEDDPEFRQRAFSQGSLNGVATVDAIHSRMSKVQGVKSVAVFSNFSSIIDESDRPPNSVQIVVLGGHDKDIANEILKTVAAGTTLLGNPVTIVDERGIERIIRFQRSIEVKIAVEITLTFEKGRRPSSDEAITSLVKGLITKKINSLGQGEDLSTPYAIGVLSDLDYLYSAEMDFRKEKESVLRRHVAISEIEVARTSESLVSLILLEHNGVDAIARDFFMSLVITVSNEFPKNGAELIRLLIFENAKKLTVGERISASNMTAGVKDKVVGIDSVGSESLGLSRNESMAAIQIPAGQIGNLKLENIIVEVKRHEPEPPTQ